MLFGIAFYLFYFKVSGSPGLWINYVGGFLVLRRLFVLRRVYVYTGETYGKWETRREETSVQSEVDECGHCSSSPLTDTLSPTLCWHPRKRRSKIAARSTPSIFHTKPRKSPTHVLNTSCIPWENVDNKIFKILRIFPFFRLLKCLSQQPYNTLNFTANTLNTSEIASNTLRYSPNISLEHPRIFYVGVSLREAVIMVDWCRLRNKPSFWVSVLRKQIILQSTLRVM